MNSTNAGSLDDSERISRSRALPLWRQVQVELEREISTGVVAAGDRLATEFELSVRFNVHRHTIRRAIEALRKKRLVRVEHGHGIFIRERTVPYLVEAGARLTETARRLGRTTDRRILATSKVRADRAVADALCVRGGDYVRRIYLLSRIDVNPVSLAEMYFPLPRFNGIEKLIRDTGSISESLTSLGVTKFRRRETRVSAKIPNRQEAEILGHSRSQPVLTIWSLDVDENMVPVTFNRSCLSTRWVELVFRF